MLGIGDRLPNFQIAGVKPGFNEIEENGESAFEALRVRLRIGLMSDPT
jgi:hypothetical protein